MFLLQLKLDQWRVSSDDQRSCCGWDRVAEPYDDLFLTSSRLPQSLLAGWDLSLSQVNPLPSPCWSGAHHHRPQLREFLQNRLKLSQHGVQCLRENNARVTPARARIYFWMWVADFVDNIVYSVLTWTHRVHPISLYSPLFYGWNFSMGHPV